MTKKRLMIKATAIVLAVVCIIGTIIFVVNKKNDDKSSLVSKQNLTIRINDRDYEEDKDKEVVLLVGLDSYDQKLSEGYQNTQMADFIYLLVIDKELRQITPIQVNRDSMTYYNVLGVRGDIVDTSYGQIALSHSYGDGGLTSLCNVKDAVSDLFYGIHIDYYASITMDGIPIINDACGGVEVDVKDDFSGVDDTIVKGQRVLLMGEHALNYVRARGSMQDSTNLARMVRQRQYVDGLYKKFIEKTKTDKNFAPDLLDKVSTYVVSSANLSDLQQLLNTARDFSLKETQVVDGTATKGEHFMEYYIDNNSLNKIVIDNFMKK